MRVVNSPNIWDNRNKKNAKRSPFVMFVPSMTLGIILAAAIIGFDMHRPAAHAGARSPSPEQAVLADSDSTAETPTEFLPEQNNLDDLLLQKLATPPPKPTPDCVAKACVALTFDDGPSSLSTANILTALDNEKVKATFFVVGSRIGTNQDVMRRMYSDGQSIGNHSWSHTDFTKLTAQQMTDQINLTQNALTALGIPAPTTFRPPYGSRNNLLRQTVKLPIIMWNVDPKDWSQKDPSKIVQIVEAQAKPGAIILMHDQVATSQAIPKIIQDLKQRYQLVTVPELLGLKADSQGEFIGR